MRVPLEPASFFLSSATRPRCSSMRPRWTGWHAKRHPTNSWPSSLVNSTSNSRAYSFCLSSRQAHSQAKFSVVLKQRVRPGRAASEIILGPRRGGQVAAIDGGAARCVRDDCPVAKELRDEFDIRRFTASRAGTGEFKQRRSSCEFLMVDGLINLRSISGIFMKKSQFLLSLSRRGGCGTMFKALRPAWVLSFAGQASTHNSHPVQSSGAT